MAEVFKDPSRPTHEEIDALQGKLQEMYSNVGFEVGIARKVARDVCDALREAKNHPDTYGRDTPIGWSSDPDTRL